jgi:hypothetical protein
VSDHTGNERDRLRALFRELHDEDLPAPGYSSLTAAGAPAASASTARPVRTFARAAWALAAATAAVAVLLALRGGSVLHPTESGRTPSSEDETLRLAASLTAWEAPTDFLLSTPGSEFLQSAPRLGSGTEDLSGDGQDLLQNEDNENDMEVFE